MKNIRNTLNKAFDEKMYLSYALFVLSMFGIAFVAIFLAGDIETTMERISVATPMILAMLGIVLILVTLVKSFFKKQ